MSSKELNFIHQGDSARLDRVLVAALAGEVGSSRSQIERWIEGGAVSVNGKVVLKPAFRVEPGDQVQTVGISESKPVITPYDFKLSILFEDEHLLVIDKPAGLSMHPGAGNRGETLANAVVNHVGARQVGVGAQDRPGIVHRLDKDTTGVVVVAKSVAVHAALSKQFAERSIERSYHALVFTTPRARRAVQLADSGDVSAPIGRHPTQRTLMTVIESGRAARTHWSVERRYLYGTLLSCKLETGRTHQIRVHMNHIGSPVIGDPVYGDFSNLPFRLKEASHRFGRQALHAATLNFIHPITQHRLSFSAPHPADFEELLSVFAGYSER